jgi:hypothetical protein
MTKVIDIDERAGTFVPVMVKFRGEEYTLGGRVAEFLAIHAVYAAHPREENESELEYAARLLSPMLRALSPRLAEALEEQDMNAAEELAFLPVLTEVAGRIGSLRFREDSE